MTSSALDQIAELQAQIAQLKTGAVNELKQKIAESRRLLAEQEAELAKLTGKAQQESPPEKKPRRAPVTDDQLRPQILAVMSANAKNGMNATAIAEKTGQPAVRVRKFLQDNPRVLRREGSGPGTKFFLP